MNELEKVLQSNSKLKRVYQQIKSELIDLRFPDDFRGNRS